MNSGDALNEYSHQLQPVSETARLDVEILLCEILQIFKAELIAYPERELANKQHKKLQEWVRRRFQGEPIAYIVGHQPFWTLDLLVTQDTLIPRPETEHLVEWVLQQDHSHETLTLLDLGVGSGAIALAIAAERPLWQIDAVDKIEAALSVAKQNAERHQINNVTFYLGSWFQALSPDKKYNFIVSNPPYIEPNDAHLQQLQFEPEAALVAEREGLADLQHIIHGAKKFLMPMGYVVVEHGFKQSLAVQRLMRDADFSEITAHRDFAGSDRFVTARNGA